jgi:Pyridoxamine 5'-phosphate oxidase
VLAAEHHSEDARWERTVVAVRTIEEVCEIVLTRAPPVDTMTRMPGWNEIEQAEPEFADKVRQLFGAGRHKTIATLRADGSPRISGIECEFTNGELRFGSMLGARKLADLERDPRFALHGPTFHPEAGKEGDWPGEAKVSGRAISVGRIGAGDDGEHPEGASFVADITEVVITRLNAEATKLVVESWTPQRGLWSVERD